MHLFGKIGRRRKGVKRRRRRERIDDPEDDAPRADGGNFGEIRVLVIGDLVDLASLRAQHAREMAGVAAGQLRAIVVDLVYEESAACQRTW